MSLFSANPLVAKLEVVYESSGVVNMLGSPNTGSSYSLPGHVVLSLPALPHSIQGRLREVRDLRVVLEGKSEFFDEHGRYTPLRLHTATVTLATPSSPLLIPPQDPQRPTSSRITLAVAFDLRLPGWLPPSHRSNLTNTSYGVVASATVGWTAGTPPFPPSPSCFSIASSSSSAPSQSSRSSNDDVEMLEIPTAPAPKLARRRLFNSSSPSSSSSTDRTEHAKSKFTEFSLHRHRLPSALMGPGHERGERHYTLRPEQDSPSPVECVVTVPDWVDVHGEEKSLKVSLRLRARRDAIVRVVGMGSTDQERPPTLAAGERLPGVAASGEGEGDDSTEVHDEPMEGLEMRKCGGQADRDETLTRMLELGMEVEEQEKFSSTLIPGFASTFPLPAEQPSSSHPLISPRSTCLEPFLGARLLESEPWKGARARQCLLADDGNQRNFFFADDGLALGGDKWRKVNVVLPMPAEDRDRDKDGGVKGELKHGGRPQAEMDGPFLRIKHFLRIRVVCRNVGQQEDTVVILSTPIRFGTSPQTIPSSSSNTSSTRPTPTTTSAPPPYIQLFHENGDLRECDPLPLYSRSPAAQRVALLPTASATGVDDCPKSPAPGYGMQDEARARSMSPVGSSSEVSSGEEGGEMEVDGPLAPATTDRESSTNSASSGMDGHAEPWKRAGTQSEVQTPGWRNGA